MKTLDVTKRGVWRGDRYVARLGRRSVGQPLLDQRTAASTAELGRSKREVRGKNLREVTTKVLNTITSSSSCERSCSGGEVHELFASDADRGERYAWGAGGSHARSARLACPNG